MAALWYQTCTHRKVDGRNTTVLTSTTPNPTSLHLHSTPNTPYPTPHPTPHHCTLLIPLHLHQITTTPYPTPLHLHSITTTPYPTPLHLHPITTTPYPTPPHLNFTPTTPYPTPLYLHSITTTPYPTTPYPTLGVQLPLLHSHIVDKQKHTAYRMIPGNDLRRFHFEVSSGLWNDYTQAYIGTDAFGSHLMKHKIPDAIIIDPLFECAWLRLNDSRVGSVDRLSCGFEFGLVTGKELLYFFVHSPFGQFSKNKTYSRVR